MRRVIQRTVTTTKIISLTITHSDEEVEYLFTTADELNAAPPPAEAATQDGEPKTDPSPAEPALPAANESKLSDEEVGV